MINKVVLIGRLTKKPDVRYTSTGMAVANFTLAVTDIGNKEKVNFINIIAFDKLGESCVNHLDKGRLVAVDGSLRTRNWLDKNGRKRYATDVVASKVIFLDKPKKEEMIENTPDIDIQIPDIETQDVPF